MMTIPPEMIDFIHNTNTTCTACVQKAKPDDRPVVWSTLPDPVDERFCEENGLLSMGSLVDRMAAAREQRVPHVTRDWA
jgi:hypothetical protein